jgi:hypothetical protein
VTGRHPPRPGAEFHTVVSQHWQLKCRGRQAGRKAGRQAGRKAGRQAASRPASQAARQPGRDMAMKVKSSAPLRPPSPENRCSVESTAQTGRGKHMCGPHSEAAELNAAECCLQHRQHPARSHRPGLCARRAAAMLLPLPRSTCPPTSPHLNVAQPVTPSPTPAITPSPTARPPTLRHGRSPHRNGRSPQPSALSAQPSALSPQPSALSHTVFHGVAPRDVSISN